ncbi:MAG: hypothetical protein WCC30_06500 [Candidatus Dormiibacterota bacterium]
MTKASKDSLMRAKQLREDDTMNPVGKSRLLTELPGNLMAATSEQLERAELTLDLIEGAHLERILHHDGRNDSALRFEISNFISGAKPDTATAMFVSLAANPRYATFLAGPAGDSVAARFGFRPAILRETALKALAADGTLEQQARSRALAALPAARRVLALAKAGRDFAVDNIRRPVATKNVSQALR